MAPAVCRPGFPVGERGAELLCRGGERRAAVPAAPWAPSLIRKVEALPESAAHIGISTGGRAIAVDIDVAPRTLVRSGTGGSKAILRTLTAQFLHQGAHALVGLGSELERRISLDGVPRLSRDRPGRRHRAARPLLGHVPAEGRLEAVAA